MKASCFVGTHSPANKIHRGQSGINIDQQSTADREADIKMTQWASRTNVFLENPKDLGGLHSVREFKILLLRIFKKI